MKRNKDFYPELEHISFSRLCVLEDVVLIYNVGGGKGFCQE